MRRKKRRTAAAYTKIRARTSKKKRALSPWFLIKFFVFILILTLTGLIYTKQKNTNVLLGYQVQKLNEELKVLKTAKPTLHLELLRIRSQENLVNLIRDHGLKLQNPEQDQIVYLNKPEPLSYFSAQDKEGSSAEAVPLKENYMRLVSADGGL